METITKEEQLFRVECRCSKCGEFLMGSNENPHLTSKDLHKSWVGMVSSAPLNAPRCPKCKYSTFSDCNAGLIFIIDDGKNLFTTEEWFKLF